MGKLKSYLARFFFKEEGGKKIIHQKHAALTGGLVFGLGLAGSILPSLLNPTDTSEIQHSSKPIAASQSTESKSVESSTNMTVGGIQAEGNRSDSNRHRQQQRPPKTIRYKAKQVFVRGQGTGEVSSIPTGASFVGKTLTKIDTRTPHAVKVILPYGGSSKGGGSHIAKNTVLLGKVSYPGQGDRVYLKFDRGVLPSGEEFSLEAQALSSKDYSPGIIGEFHGNTGSRIAAVLGLSMVSGMSEVLVEKEALGQGYTATPKATLKNGFFNGAAKVADMESQRQAERLAATPEYVTVEAGSDVIVSLTGALKEL
ncbi:MAG: TrbI/VirB10 family protein [Bdellovibrionaceae bacterium]|nr:TrbI/VirB10 family protein [Pseudobdellovibrionaceae bacterium]